LLDAGCYVTTFLISAGIFTYIGANYAIILTRLG